MLFCHHSFSLITSRTLVCDKCGKVKKVECDHEWKNFVKAFGGIKIKETSFTEYKIPTINQPVLCSKCGEFKVFVY